MAILKGPLMSIDARGKLADTLVFSGWKGLKTARSYVVPANPRTEDQIAQRDRMASAVRFYTQSITGTPVLNSWRGQATRDPRPLSGANLAVSNFALALGAAAEAVGVTAVQSVAAGALVLNVRKLADGSQSGAQSEVYALFAGQTISQMVQVDTASPDASHQLDFDGVTLPTDVDLYYTVFLLNGEGVPVARAIGLAEAHIES